MTLRQERFCWAYLVAFANGAEGARQAGYKPRWARCQASRLLRRRDVQELLRRIRAELSHPRCLVCGQPLLDSGYSQWSHGEWLHVKPILESWNRAMWYMVEKGEIDP